MSFFASVFAEATVTALYLRRREVSESQSTGFSEVSRGSGQI